MFHDVGRQNPTLSYLYIPTSCIQFPIWLLKIYHVLIKQANGQISFI